MATNFPSSLDSLTNPTSTDALNSPSHADQHANVNDAVEALEAKVGVDGSAVTSSLDFKVTASKTVTDKIDPAGASADQVLKFNGTKFVPATGSSLTASDTPPGSPVAGELWYESDTGRTFIRYDSAWVEIGNATDVTGVIQPSQITGLSAVTSLTTDDVFAVVDNPSSATVTNKITYGNLVTAMSSSISNTGGVWVDYTPTLVQGSAVAKTVGIARYFQFQKMVLVTIQLNVTGSGTINNAVTVGLPIAARVNVNQPVGSGYVFDNGGVGPQFNYNCTAYLSTTTTFLCLYQAGSPWGSNPNYALANGDQISFTLMYEAA